MHNHLLKALSNYITPDLVARAADTLDESETSVFKAMSAAIPTLLIGLLNKTNDIPVIEKIVNLANNEALNTDNILSDLPSLLTDKGDPVTLKSGTSVLQLLFEDKQPKLFETLEKTLSIKKSSIFRLILMSAPMVLAHIKDTNLNTEQLIKSLTSEKDEILKAAPLGLQALLDQQPVIQPEVKTRIKKVKPKHTERVKHRWIIPLLIFVAAILMLVIMS